MKNFIIACFVLAAMFCIFGCKSSDSSDDGTITVYMSGSTIATAHGLYAYLYENGETDFNNSATVLACNWHQVLGGMATFVLKVDDGSWSPTAEDWVGSGGSTYDLYVYTAGDSGQPGSSDYMTDPMPIEVTIDGNMNIDIDFADMIPYVDP